MTLVSSLPGTATNKGTYFGDKTAADATIVLTNSTTSATITLYNLKNPDEGMGMSGKDEQLLILRSAARRDASDPDISVTIDETV